MKKRLIILALTITLTLSVILASLLIVNALSKENSNMVLMVKDGYVVLKRGEKVIEIYDDIVLDVLPKADREALINGIIIENEEHLYSIIEDYDG